MASGLIAVQAGADITKSATYERTADSRFPFVRIFKEGFVISSSTIKHELGFLAAFFFIPVSTNNEIDGDDSGNYGASLDRDKITISGKGYYYIFDFNLENEFDAGDNIVGESGARENNVGLKVLKNESNEDINSKDPRDFTLTTQTRSLSIHKNIIIDVPSPVPDSIKVNHNLGYLPNYLLYRESGGTIINGGAFVTANNYTMDISGFGIAGRWYLLILKEPFAT